MREGVPRVLLRIRDLWRRDPKGMSIDLLRVGIGIVWALNMIFILAPSNRYFPMFQAMASGFGPSSLGGPGLANFVASNPVFFSWLIAGVTVYLAFAFLLGLTTRLACVVGGLASVAFLLTQFYATFALNGNGTDVGPHPLYLLIYLILFTAGAGQYFALDQWMWKNGKARFPRLSRWIASPRDLPCNATCPAAGRGTGRSGPPAEEDADLAWDPSPGLSTPPREGGRGTLWGLLLVAVVLVLAGVGVAHLVAVSSAKTSSPTEVDITNIQLMINYSANVTQEGFGPPLQNGCWGCVQSVAPGASFSTVSMLTNNHSGISLTVTSLAVDPPFVLLYGPHTPQTVPPGKMWMFNLGIGTPKTPGSYVVVVTYSVVE